MSSVSAEERDVDIDIARLAGAVWARRLTVIVSTLAFAALALAAASLVAPVYKADTQLVIETRESAYTRTEPGSGGSEATLDPESVESQVSLMTSAEILGAVADRFSLSGREEFQRNPSFVDRLISRVRPVETSKGDVVAAMREKLEVYRKENQRVLVVEFSSKDPELARDVPNAIAAEYLARQQGALLSSNTDATGWLEEEIADLRQAVRTAEGKVAAFRASSDLLIGQNQDVLATQQLSELTSELSRTRAARVAAEGRAQSIRDAIVRGLSLDSVSEVLSSPTIQALRERQISLKSQIADLSTTLLDGHPRLRSLRSQLRDVEREIASEAANVQSSLETASDAARQREAALESEVERLKGESARAGEEGVELRSLEREAAAQSQLLESYLTRYREAVARGSRDYLPVDARVFSEAQLPVEPYFPKIVPITAAAGLGGFLFSALAILLSELFSGRGLRPAPVLNSGQAMRRPGGEGAPIAAAPRDASPGAAASPPQTGRGPSSPPAARRDSGSLQPTTGAAELGEAIIASDIRRVVIVSATAPDGAEPRAASNPIPAGVALARSLSARSHATMLVDLTTDGRSARAMGASADAAGVADLVRNTASFADVIQRDVASTAHVLPPGGPVAGDEEAGVADGMHVILDALARAYGSTLIDCGASPPSGLAALMSDDTALVLAFEDGEEDAVEATLRGLAEAGWSDIVLMNRRVAKARSRGRSEAA